jgi:hypothetical protein
MQFTDNPQAIIERVRQRYQRRASFAGHAILFGCFALFSIIFMLTPDIWRRFMTLPNSGDVFFLFLIWGAIFVSHAARFYFQEAGDRAVEHEMEQFGWRREREKRKIGHLSDDGGIDEDPIDSLIDDHQSRTQ